MSRHLLLISPRTFGYEREICSGIEFMGYSVDWFDERPSTSSLSKALIRFNPELFKIISDSYFKKIINKSKSKSYDIILIIKGEALSEKNLASLKLVHPKAKFVYYTWDSLKNVKNIKKKLSHFEKCYSFDRYDCIENKSITHLPLFYLPMFSNKNKKIAAFDLLFIGSIHSDRYSVTDNIFNIVQKKDPFIKINHHYYYQSKFFFLIQKIFNKNFRTIPWGKIKWKSLSLSETSELMSECRIMIDVQHPAQTGLTMRTIECLGAHVKLITTNVDIVNYDFYHPENILIVDRYNPDISEDFITSKFQETPSHIYERYSLCNWLHTILET